MEQFNTHIGRRDQSRLRVQLRARLDLIGGVRPCVLSDISKTGARVEMDNPPRAGECAVLFVEAIESFGTIVWRSPAACGIRFDDEIRDGQLIALRQKDDSIADLEKHEATKSARKWAQNA